MLTVYKVFDFMYETLLEFFDNPDDWPFVMNYGRYGIAKATITNRLDDFPDSGWMIRKKRIVILLNSGSVFSVIWLSTMPQGSWSWECMNMDGALDPAVYSSTQELFEYLKSHA